MALPNNALYVEGRHDEQAGGDLFDHLASEQLSLLWLD